MLTCNNISLISLNKVVFTNLSVTFLPGTIAIIRGKNGAGKTSLLRVIAGIQSPTLGNIYINNNDIHILEQPIYSYLGHNLGFKEELSVIDNLTFWSALYNSMELIPAAISYLQLDPYLNEPLYKLSSGFKKRVAIARLVSCCSKIWLLDEIETNLDQYSTQLVYHLMAAHADAGGIIIWASHASTPWKNILEINIEKYKK